MKIEKIKPIPKYMLSEIKRTDLKHYPAQDGYVRYYSYFTKNDGELVQVSVAVKNHRNKWYCKQVAVHGLHSEKCFVKDIYYAFIGGYVVGWYEEGLSKYQKWYEYGEWGWSDDKYFNLYAPCLNLDYVLKQPIFKYSAADLYPNARVLKYLRLYEKYPQAEYLIKAGLYDLATSKTILSRIGKDKQFAKWLMRNRNELAAEYHYYDVIIRAYTSNKPLKVLQKEKELKLKYAHDDIYQKVLKRLPKEKQPCLMKYLLDNNISSSTYSDYIAAAEYLRLDLTEGKNSFPHDFKFWHDTRIDEYKTAKALKDKEDRQQLYMDFARTAQKYIALEYSKNATYIAVIAESPTELITEGEMLHHCVGHMGYDQKFVREESLIFFIRTKANPEVPFVTVEYSPSKHKILQCHGNNNAMPDDKTMHYIQKIWLPYANKQLKRISA